MMNGGQSRVSQLLESEFGQELLRGGFIVVAVVAPKQFCERQDLVITRAIHSIRMSHDHVEDRLLPQTEARHLVVDDRIDSDRGLGEPIGQRLLLGC
jgi:hypothetical protein